MHSSVTERRTQVYFSEKLHRQLKEAARRRGVSMAEVVRQAVDQYLAETFGEKDWESDPIHRIVGLVKDTKITDAAENHDAYLYGAQPKGKSKRGGKRA